MVDRCCAMPIRAQAVNDIIKPAIGSKQSGYEDFLGELVTNVGTKTAFDAPHARQACQAILPKENNKPFNVDNVRVAKILGSGVLSSSVVKARVVFLLARVISAVQGMVFKRQIEGEITHIEKAKAGCLPRRPPLTPAQIAVYTCAIDTTLTETKARQPLPAAAAAHPAAGHRAAQDRRGAEDVQQGRGGHAGAAAARHQGPRRQRDCFGCASRATCGVLTGRRRQVRGSGAALPEQVQDDWRACHVQV